MIFVLIPITIAVLLVVKLVDAQLKDIQSFQIGLDHLVMNTVQLLMDNSLFTNVVRLIQMKVKLSLFLNLLLANKIFVLILEMTAVLLVLKLVVVQKPVILYSLIILVNLSGMIVYLITDKILFTNVVLLLNQ